MSKVGIGLKNVHYALLTKDDKTGTTYGTPKPLAPAITANVSPTVNSATLNADDGPLVTANSLGEIAVEIGVSDIPFEVRAELLGKTINADGVLLDSADDQAPEVALGYERTLNDGTSRFIWLLKGKFRDPADEAQTKQNEVAFQTPTLAGTFLKRIFDNRWRAVVESGRAGTSQTVIENWFKAVYDPSTAPTTPTP